MLARYAKEKGFDNTRFYVDDGYTGTNFNRPDFKRMMEDVEAGYISTIIVKDMSRFGRNDVEVGLYTESYFPENNIRFIAITDLVEVLTMKTEAIVQNEKRRINSELQRCTSRQNTVNTLYEKLYEDNALGKVTDEWFLHMSQKYGVEREELKAKIQKLHEELDELNDKKSERVAFVEAIRRFIRMETITAHPFFTSSLTALTFMKPKARAKTEHSVL